MAARESQDVPRRIADLDGRDAYVVLGIRPDAGPDEIKAAYRRELARNHPDLGGSDRRAQLVNCAFDVLTRHRDDYDDLRESVARAVGPDVLFIEPDAEPLDDPLPGHDRGWWAGRGLVLAAAALLVVAGAVVLGRGDQGDQGAGTPTGWTAGEVGPGATPSGAPSTAGTASTANTAGTAGTAGTQVVAPAPEGSAADLPTAPEAAPSSWSVPATVVVMAATAPPSGGGHRCEVRGDGSLWCAGGNARGQLGDGSSADAAAPVRVAGPPGARWSAVSVGGLTSCGLQDGGALWCWGDNSYGQLGDGTDSARPLPVAVEPQARWLAVDVDTHVCAVRTDHTLWCWGAGSAGELGDGPLVDRATPIQVGTEAGWVSVVADPGRTCAVRQDGSRQCWGTGRAGAPTR